MGKPNISIGCDHAGFELKQHLVAKLRADGYSVEDFGAHSNDSVDYPDFAHAVAESVAEEQGRFGILLCGSGNGINMTANKHADIRAALCWTQEIASLARLHNNANILTLPARFVSEEEADDIVNKFLTSEFEGGRHGTRVAKISKNITC